MRQQIGPREYAIALFVAALIADADLISRGKPSISEWVGGHLTGNHGGSRHWPSNRKVAWAIALYTLVHFNGWGKRFRFIDPLGQAARLIRSLS